MKRSKVIFRNTKDKMQGKINEAAGEITGNEQLELKGKIQVAKVDFKKKVDPKRKVNEFKDNIARRINNRMDRKG